MNRPFGNVPTDHGVREAAKRLGMDFGWLSRVCRREGSLYAPDRSRIEGGREVPMWSERRLQRIAARLEKEKP